MSKRPRAAPFTENSALVDCVRTFLDEHVPEGYSVDEKNMFGFAMFLVRGNMFLGVNHRSERLLVRIGEERVESALAPPGVTRCGSENGRVFRGTIMVEPELYKGDDRLATWFNLAMAHNATMEAKEAQEKPRKKKRAMASFSAATKDDDDEEVLEASDSEDEAAPPTAPAPRPSTTGAQFARCVLHVIQNIPPGKVAAYGQVAALAGAPRNARQVGAMLRDGLCMGGAPWHRVLNASGKISLPADAGGDRQRELLASEGVKFVRDAVATGTFWTREAPFFAA